MLHGSLRTFLSPVLLEQPHDRAHTGEAVALRAFRYIPIAKESGVVHLSLHTGPPPRPRTCEPGSTMIAETRSILRRLRSRLRAYGRAALGLRPTSLFNVQSVLGPRPKAGSETQSRRRVLRTPL